MIIVEGPDNAGKTRFCKLLENLFRYKIVHGGSRPMSQQEVDARYKTAYENCKSKKIQDRNFVIGQIVYGTIFNDGFKRPENSLRKLLQQKPIFVYCRPSHATLTDFSNHEIKKHDNAEDIKKVEAKQEEVIQEYDNLFEYIRSYADVGTVFKYNYELGSISTELLSVILNKEVK